MGKAVDLHELVNMPGAGKAEKILQDAGHWKVETPEDAPLWRVNIDYTVSFIDVLTVQASTKAEAVKAAVDQIDIWSGHAQETRVDFITAEQDSYAQHVDIVAGRTPHPMTAQGERDEISWA